MKRMKRMKQSQNPNSSAHTPTRQPHTFHVVYYGNPNQKDDGQPSPLEIVGDSIITAGVTLFLLPAAAVYCAFAECKLF